MRVECNFGVKMPGLVPFRYHPPGPARSDWLSGLPSDCGRDSRGPAVPLCPLPLKHFSLSVSAGHLPSAFMNVLICISKIPNKIEHILIWLFFFFLSPFSFSFFQCVNWYIGILKAGERKPSTSGLDNFYLIKKPTKIHSVPAF